MHSSLAFLLWSFVSLHYAFVTRVSSLILCQFTLCIRHSCFFFDPLSVYTMQSSLAFLLWSFSVYTTHSSLAFYTTHSSLAFLLWSFVSLHYAFVTRVSSLVLCQFTLRIRHSRFFFDQFYHLRRGQHAVYCETLTHSAPGTWTLKSMWATRHYGCTICQGNETIVSLHAPLKSSYIPRAHCDKSHADDKVL